jgi:hypothetical protein
LSEEPEKRRRGVRRDTTEIEQKLDRLIRIILQDVGEA